MNVDLRQGGGIMQTLRNHALNNNRVISADDLDDETKEIVNGNKNVEEHVKNFKASENEFIIQ
jgi:hypothetical protein